MAGSSHPLTTPRTAVIHPHSPLSSNHGLGSPTDSAIRFGGFFPATLLLLAGPSAPATASRTAACAPPLETTPCDYYLGLNLRMHGPQGSEVQFKIATRPEKRGYGETKNCVQDARSRTASKFRFATQIAPTWPEHSLRFRLRALREANPHSSRWWRSADRLLRSCRHKHERQ